MCLDARINLTRSEGTTVDCTELAGDLLESLVSAFAVSDNCYGVPRVFQEHDHPNTYEIPRQIISGCTRCTTAH